MKKNVLLISMVCLIACSDKLNNSETEQEVKNFVQSFYKTWAVEENTEKLQNYFAEDFFTISPADSFRLSGREKNIDGYRNFLKSIDILNYKTMDEQVQIYNDGNCAIVTLNYKMQMLVGKDTVLTDGRDMLVMIKKADKWKLVADHFSNFPKK